ncbi:MAG: SusC/RagA family TonB-linked outer membrane protein [Ferruginibacter sp.]
MKKFLLMLMLASVTVITQAQVKVNGKISGANNAPLAGASVTEKGTSNGTSADASGSFSIDVKTGAKLIITAVGYETKEVNASGNLSITLSAESRSLTEVVVTGTGVATTRKKLGIAVESISADKLPQAPTASIDQALIGKIPGAQISTVDGSPGAKTNILLRGINTIQGGTKPMILYDGVELAATDISQLDLSNIERVEVVQGAAAATIYGAQGANGVIQLFSKKGKNGKVQIDISTSYASSTLINSGHLTKAKLHSFKTDANGNVVDNSGQIIQLSPTGTYDGVTWQFPAGSYVSAMGNPGNVSNKPYDKNLKYYDHFKQLFTNAPTTNNTLNISGGGEKSDFAITISNLNQKSNIRNNGSVNRTNLTVNVGTEIFKGLRIRSLTQGIYTKNTLNPFYSFGRNNMYNMLNVSPFYDLNQRAEDGNFPYRLTTGTVSVNGFNPFYDFQYSSSNNKTVDFVQNLQLNYKVNRFVELDAKYGINYQRNDVNELYMNQTVNASSERWLSGGLNTGWAGRFNQQDNTGEIANFNYTTTTQNFLGSAFIRTDFQKDFHLNLPITTSTQLAYDYRKTYYTQYVTYGFGLPTYPVYNLNQAAVQGVASKDQMATAGFLNSGDYRQTFVTYGYLLNQKFDIGDYGGFSAGFRTDYSSAFGKGAKPFTFPRGDAYIRPSSFNFWKNSTISNAITEWKIRAAYGEAGIQPGAYDRQITLPSAIVGNITSFNAQYIKSNPDIKVERTKELEIGTDIFFKGGSGSWLPRANFSFTYWKRNSDDVIYTVNLPPSEGADAILDNTIFMSAKGIQASLNLGVFSSKNFSWDFTTNFSKQTSKIDRINGPDVVLTTTAGNSNLVLTAGQKVGQMFGLKAFTSLDQRRKDGSAYIDKADYGKYELVNGYVVDTATKSIQFTNEFYAFGDPNPKFNMSFINSFTYKDFLTVGFQVDWVYGSHLYNQTKEWMYRDGVHGDFDKPVTINGTTAAYVAYYRSAYADFFGVQNGARNTTKDYFYESASFARLRNVSIAFDAAKFIKIKGFRKLQLVLTGRNLVTITNYTGFDPESNSALNNNSAWERGIDHNSIPNLKTYQIGLNVGF